MTDLSPRTPQTFVHREGEAVPLRLDTQSRVFIWLFCLSFVFDFKGADGGSQAHIWFTAAAAIGCAGYILVGRSFRIPRQSQKGIRSLLILWWGYLLASAVTAYLEKVSTDHYARVILPFLLAGLGLLVMRKFGRAYVDAEYLIRPLLVCSLISCIWTFIYAVVITGLDINFSRYQILSSATPFLLGYGAWLLTSGRKPSPVDIVAVGTAALFVILSITRSYLLIFGALLLGLIAFSRGTALEKKAKRAAAILAAIALIGMPILIAAERLRPGFIEDWSQRIFDSSTSTGEDVTYLTRIAEYSGQWQDLSAQPMSLLIGKGVGSDYFWDFDYAGDLKGFVPQEELAGSYWYPGHSMWVYSIYSSGLLFGWIVPAALLIACYQSFRIARRRSTSGLQLSPVAALPFFVILAYLAYSFTSHPFAYRMSGLILGIMMGLPFTFPSTRSTAKVDLATN